jgi:hypothetical protein
MRTKGCQAGGGVGVPRAKKSFSHEFTDEAVKTVIETSRPIAGVAKELGINEGTLELVRSIMREPGLEACQPKPWRFSITEGDGREHDTPDLVNRDFTADAPGEKMVGDNHRPPLRCNGGRPERPCAARAHRAEDRPTSGPGSGNAWFTRVHSRYRPHVC